MLVLLRLNAPGSFACTLRAPPEHALHHSRFVWKNQWKIKETAAAWRGTRRCGRRLPTLQNIVLAAGKTRSHINWVMWLRSFCGRQGALESPGARPWPLRSLLPGPGRAPAPLWEKLQNQWKSKCQLHGATQARLWRLGMALCSNAVGR